ncbi:restriction endonuclease subunit S, partial [Prevotella sp. MGM1]
EYMEVSINKDLNNGSACGSKLSFP